MKYFNFVDVGQSSIDTKIAYITLFELVWFIFVPMVLVVYSSPIVLAVLKFMYHDSSIPYS